MLPKHWRVGAFYYRAFTAEEKSLLPVKLATLGISIRAENLQPLIFDQWLCRSVFFRFCRIFKYVPKIDIVWLCPKTYPDFSTRQDLYNRWIQLHRQDRTSSR